MTNMWKGVPWKEQLFSQGPISPLLQTETPLARKSAVAGFGLAGPGESSIFRKRVGKGENILEGIGVP